MVRLGADEHNFFLSPRLALFNILAPPMQIPQSAIADVRTYNSSGIVSTAKDPGVMVQVTYDPNFRGAITEITVGDPAVFLQIQSESIDPLIARLGRDGGSRGHSLNAWRNDATRNG